jgi:nucleotide-binding universal stress UspA family protein
VTAVVPDPEIRRILVALDASQHSQHALDVAVQLAAWHNAEVEGLYVEDINLLRLAALGVGQEIGPTSPSPLPIDPGQLARRLSLGAAEARRSLADTAARHSVRWAFRVERGHVASVICHAAGEVDIVALGRAGAGRPGPGRLGSTAHALTDQLPQSVIVVQAPVTTGQNVMTFFDGSECGRRAVTTAASLCERLQARLVILATEKTATAEESGATPLATAAAELAGDLDVAFSVRTIRTDADLVRAIREEDPSLCIVGCETTSEESLLRQLANRLPVSVYLVK